MTLVVRKPKIKHGPTCSAPKTGLKGGEKPDPHDEKTLDKTQTNLFSSKNLFKRRWRKT